MSRVQLILLVACMVAMAAGCRSRRENGCYDNGWLSGSPRVAPPPTYSLNIPSVAKNQPYYTPGTGTPNSSIVDPNQRAPTAAGVPGSQTPGNGVPNSNGAQAGGSRSAVTTPTTFVETQPTNGQPYRQVASATGAPGTGFSYTSSANYQSTNVDERLDSTRLPVTDASSVRAPARNYPTGGAANLSQLQQNPAVYPPGYTVPPGTQQTYVAQNQPYNPNFGNPPGGQAGSPVSYQGQAVLRNPNGYPISPTPGTMPQSLPNMPPTMPPNMPPNASGQTDWRNPEMNSERF